MRIAERVAVLAILSLCARLEFAVARTVTAVHEGRNANGTVVVLLARYLSQAIRRRHTDLVTAGLNAHIVVEAALEVRPASKTGLPAASRVAVRLRSREHHTPAHVVLASGFTDLISRMGSRRVSAWDGALYWCHQERVAFCWLAEDDVLWDSPGALAALVTGYAGNTAGLVAHAMPSPEPGVPSGGRWSHSDACAPVLGPTAATTAPAFCPLARVSGALLDALAGIAHARGRLCFLEVLLPAVAAQSGLGVSLFDSDVLMQRPDALAASRLPRMAMRFRPTFNATELVAHAASIYHPVKSLQSSLRAST